MSRHWFTVCCFVLGTFLSGSLFAQERTSAVKDGLREQYRPDDRANRQVTSQSSVVRSNSMVTDVLVNNNLGAQSDRSFTQSEASLVAYGNNVVIGFNDAGSYNGSNNHFTGWSYSTDGGATFIDGGTFPNSTIGDAGDPVVARNSTTGRIYLSTLGFSSPGTIQVWRSDDNGATWMAPVNGTPGGSSEDKQWHTVDNFPGTGNGNVYLVSRNFSSGNGVYFYRSTDHGSTFGPSGGTLIVSGNQGAFVAVGPDHSVYAFWFNGTTIQMRKSTDFGVTFAPAVVVVSGLVGGTNGDLGLTGIRQGTTTAAGFRSNEFPHVAINPVTGYIYVTFDNDGTGSDKADVFFVQSTNQGTTWSAAVKINDDVTTTDQWQPTIAVTPTGTKLGIFYYSRQEDPTGNNLFKFYGRIGTIAGTTVSWGEPSFAISDVGSLPEFGRDAVVNSVYMGDYTHAVATATAFHVIWSDNRDDLPGGAPRKDPNMYYEKIPVTDDFGWVEGTITNVSGGAPIQGVTIDFVEPVVQAGTQSLANGYYIAGARVDTPGTTVNLTLRSRKFGFRDTTLAVTLTRNDTLLRNFQMTPAAGGTLTVHAYRNDNSGIRTTVHVFFGGNEVATGNTDSTTGLYSTPLPAGTYNVTVDPPNPYATRTFNGTVINVNQTTTIQALMRYVVEPTPTAMRDTLAVGQVHAKTLQLINTTTDSVPYRLSDDVAAARMRFSKPAVQPNPTPVLPIERPKGAPDAEHGTEQIDGQGGPDAFGYKWIDSDEPGGPTYSWVEISGVGTAITGLGDDSNVGPFPIGFTFPFYGNNYTQIRLCSNGWISFTSTSTAYSNGSIPSAAEPNNAIYGFWDDLLFSTTNGSRAFYYYDAANTRFIVQYDSVAPFSGTARYTFQIILRPNGEILTQYRSMVGTLTSATIGIENANGTVALQVVNSAAYVHDNLATRYYLPDAPWISENPSFGTIPPSTTQNITVTFDANGLIQGTTYNGNISMDLTHPDVAGSILVPASLRVISASTPTISINPTSLTFPTTIIGATRRDSARVRNVGVGTLTITSVTTTNPRYAATITSSSIAGGDSARLRVAYTPVIPGGTDTGRVVVLSNDVANPRVDVILTGTSVGAPILAARIDSLVKPAMQIGTRDSIRFYVRNTGTAAGNLAARAIMYPRTAPNGQTPSVIEIPMTITPAPIELTPEQRSILHLPAFGSAPHNTGTAAGNGRTLRDQLTDLLGERGFGYEYFGVNFVKFNLATPGTLVPLGSFTSSDAIYSGDFTNDGNSFYAIKGSTNQLIRVDTSNGSYTVVGPVTISGGHTWTALKFDPSGTLYATSTSGSVSTLYTIDPVTGNTTQVGTITGVPVQIAMAIHPTTGQMYVYDIDNGGTLQSRFFSVDKTTGAATLIGNMGFVGRFAQDCDFDPQTNTLYAAAYNFGISPATAELRTIDLATGASTLIGVLGVPQREIDGFAIKGVAGGGGAEWLSIVPTSGPIALNDSVLFTARFDATSPSIIADPGNYFGRVEINTVGAPVPDTLKLPARMFVAPSAGADLYVQPDSVNIGDVEIGVTDSSKSVLVKNIGAASLTVTNVTFTGASGFSASRTNFTLTSLDTLRIKVRFTAPAPGGVRTARMNFVCNDPTPGSVGLRAVSVGVPHIVVAPDTFFYDLQATNDTTRSNFRIRNTGTDTLHFTLDEGLSSSLTPASVIRSTTQQQTLTLAKGASDPRPGEGGIDGQGGPDAFGYRWIDSDEPGGPTYNWVEINTIGTQITGLGDDTNVGPFPIGFSFPFYGNNYTDFRFCSNGWLSFTSTSTAYSNEAIPSAAEPNNALYPFWDDLNFTEPGGTAWYYYDAANTRLIVQWDSVSHYSPSTTPGRYTCQVILYPNGNIYYQYRRMEGTLNSATIGIESPAGAIGLQVVFNADYMHDNLAILLTKDLLPWMSTDITQGTIRPGDSTTVQLRIHPAGVTPGNYAGRVVITGDSPDIRYVRVGMIIRPNGVNDNRSTIPTAFNLSQNFPNPFNPSTKINYDLPEQATVTLKIYNVLGQEVLTLMNGPQSAGYYESVWDGRNNAGATISSGVYFYRLEAVGQSGQTFTSLKKMLFLK